ncbi:MAG: hypothetical protein V4530_01525 [Pseudomonadota bacterium]
MARKVSTLQRLPLAPVIGAMFGAAAAVLVAATPDWLFAQVVGASGMGIRLLAVVAAFALVGGAIWGLVKAVERLMAPPAVARTSEELDLATFNEALPLSNEVRRPISAGELGAPLMSDEALRTVPPLVQEPVEEPLPEAEPIQEPIAVMAEAEEATVDGQGTTIEALIARLEAGLARYGKPTPPTSSGPAATPPATGKASSWIVREDDAGNDPSATLRRAFAG